jgi:Phosphoribosyl-ATP pyrophosphohydrolase
MTGSNFVADIEELHGKFTVNDNPDNMHGCYGVSTIIDTVKSWPIEKQLAFLQFRIDFIHEECTELDEAHNQRDADKVIDALIDICVIAIGTLYVFGVDVKKAWYQVHDANMIKTPGTSPERPNDFGLPDLLKPKGWTPPSHLNNLGLLEGIYLNKE